MTRHQSGSPTAWKARREAYQKRSGPVSNPGQPSPTNRQARRLAGKECDYVFNDSGAVHDDQAEVSCGNPAVAWASDTGSGERMRMCARCLARESAPIGPEFP